jgi:hypothetical protein
LSESTGEPTREYAVRGEPFMVIDRITQELITQQLKAAHEQLDIIANAMRDDWRATDLSLVYVSTVNARTYLDGALKQLPWAPIPVDDGPRAVTPPPDARGGP